MSATGAASVSRGAQPVTADPPSFHSNGSERSGQNPLPPTCRQLIGSVRFARYSAQELATASPSLSVGTLGGLDGRAVAMIYADFAASGSTVHRRPEFSRMLTHAEDHQFDIIIAEDIDRLARGEGDAPKLRQRLEFLGIEMHTCTDGHITKL